MDTFFQNAGEPRRAERQIDAANAIEESQSTDRPIVDEPEPDQAQTQPAPQADRTAELQARLERLEAERELERERLEQERSRLEQVRESVLAEQRQREAAQRQQAEWAARQQQIAQHLQPPQVDYEEALTDPKKFHAALAAEREYQARLTAWQVGQIQQQVQAAASVLPVLARPAKDWARTQARAMAQEEGVPAEDFDAAWNETLRIVSEEQSVVPEILVVANQQARRALGRHLPSKGKPKPEPSVTPSGRTASPGRKEKDPHAEAIAAAEARLGVPLSAESKAQLARRMAADAAGALG